MRVPVLDLKSNTADVSHCVALERDTIVKISLEI